MDSHGNVLGQHAGFEKFTIRLNNRKILNGLLEKFGLSDSSVAVLRALDKLSKIGSAKVQQEMLETTYLLAVLVTIHTCLIEGMIRMSFKTMEKRVLLTSCSLAGELILTNSGSGKREMICRSLLSVVMIRWLLKIGI